MAHTSGDRYWFVCAVAGILAVPIAFWVVFHLVFHATPTSLAIPILLFEVLQVVMTPLFYIAWRHHESSGRDLRAIYAVCGGWGTIGAFLLLRDLYIFGILAPTTNMLPLYETVWIGGPSACLVAYFLAKRIYVGSGEHS